MRIAIITQEDRFVVPRNVQAIVEMTGVDLVKIISLDTSGALQSRKSVFAKGFGFSQTLCMGGKILGASLYDLFDSVTGFRLSGRKRSVRAVARRNHIAFEKLTGVKDMVFWDDLRSLELDLIVSFSAPCVFPPELLEIPRLGCINLHCSYLPNYAGLLPSFWALFYQESETGVSVHYMDDRIDNGSILAQKRVSIDPGMSMFQLIKKTKRIGGDLVCDVIGELQSGKVESISNSISDDCYYSWPTVEQMREFRKRGGRLI